MTDAKSELIIAKTILSAQAEILISREKRIRNIREKAFVMEELDKHYAELDRLHEEEMKK